jgi:hypothetical protein
MRRIKREKGFASGLIVPATRPLKNKTRKGFREWSNCSRRPAWWRIRQRFFFWQIQRNGSHCNGWPTQVKKKWSHCDGWPTQVKRERKMRARRCARKEARAHRRAWENVRAHRCARRETRAQRRARQEVRAQKRVRKRWGPEGALKREVGLGNALPWMVKGSKAHFKGDEGSKAP